MAFVRIFCQHVGEDAIEAPILGLSIATLCRVHVRARNWAGPDGQWLASLARSNPDGRALESKQAAMRDALQEVVRHDATVRGGWYRRNGGEICLLRFLSAFSSAPPRLRVKSHPRNSKRSRGQCLCCPPPVLPHDPFNTSFRRSRP